MIILFDIIFLKPLYPKPFLNKYVLNLVNKGAVKNILRGDCSDKLTTAKISQSPKIIPIYKDSPENPQYGIYTP